MSVHFFSKGWLDANSFPIFVPLWDRMFQPNPTGHWVKRWPLALLRNLLEENFELKQLNLRERIARAHGSIALATFYQWLHTLKAISIASEALENSGYKLSPVWKHSLAVIPPLLTIIPSIVTVPLLSKMPLPLGAVAYPIYRATAYVRQCRDHFSKVTHLIMAVAAFSLWTNGRKAYAAGILASLIYPIAMDRLARHVEVFSPLLKPAFRLSDYFFCSGVLKAADEPMGQAIYSILSNQAINIAMEVAFACSQIFYVEPPFLEDFDLNDYCVVGKPTQFPADLSWPEDKIQPAIEGIEDLLESEWDKAHITHMLRTICRDEEKNVWKEAEKKKKEILPCARKTILDVMSEEIEGSLKGMPLYHRKTLPALAEITRRYLVRGEEERQRRVLVFLLKKLSLAYPPALFATVEDQVELAQSGYFCIRGTEAVDWLYAQRTLMQLVFKQPEFTRRDVTQKLYELGLLAPESSWSKLVQGLIKKIPIYPLRA